MRQKSHKNPLNTEKFIQTAVLKKLTKECHKKTFALHYFLWVWGSGGGGGSRETVLGKFADFEIADLPFCSDFEIADRFLKISIWSILNGQLLKW